jgi:GAF domain-containing protein
VRISQPSRDGSVLDVPAPLHPELDETIGDLRDRTESQRCTLRLNVPGGYAFPVVSESCGPGVASLRDFQTLPQLAGPTFRRMQREHGLVVQNDCRAAAAGADEEFAEPYFRQLIELYGGMSAFIAVPVFIWGELEGVVSVHALGHPRAWAGVDIAAAEAAADAITHALDCPQT